MQNIALLLLSLVATLLGAISGIGGGIIIKPLLDATTEMGASVVNFLSGCSALSMSVVALISSREADVKLDAKRGTYLAVGAALGGISGKILFDMAVSQKSGNGMIVVIQSSILLVLTLLVAIYVRYKYKITLRNMRNVFICLFVGCSLGLISAFLGIGGGPINLMILSFLFGMDSKTSALHSIYIIFLSQLSSLFITVSTNKIPSLPSDYVLLFMVAGGVLGGYLGSKARKKMNNTMVDKVFTGILILVCCICIWNIVRYLGI